MQNGSFCVEKEIAPKKLILLLNHTILCVPVIIVITYTVTTYMDSSGYSKESR